MSEIDNGLRADIMRKRMEDKNTLSHKGSLYVGTGEKETINGVDIYKTQELQAPTETSDGFPLGLTSTNQNISYEVPFYYISDNSDQVITLSNTILPEQYDVFPTVKIINSSQTQLSFLLLIIDSTDDTVILQKIIYVPTVPYSQPISLLSTTIQDKYVLGNSFWLNVQYAYYPASFVGGLGGLYVCYLSITTDSSKHQNAYTCFYKILY